ncbi:hypothetical protein V2J09_004738 [Rumex salicifolius]
MDVKSAKAWGRLQTVAAVRRGKSAKYATQPVRSSHTVFPQISALKAPSVKLGKRKKPDACQLKCRSCKYASQRSLYRSYSNFMKSGLPCRLMCYMSDEWVDLPSEFISLVKKDFELKKGATEVILNGRHLLLDFLHKILLDVKTGTEQPMAWIDKAGNCFFPEVFVSDGPQSQPLENKEDSSGVYGGCGQHEITVQIDIELNGTNDEEPVEYCGESNPSIKRVKNGQNHAGLDAEGEDSCDRVSDMKANDGFQVTAQLKKNFEIELKALASEEVMDMFLEGMNSTVGIDVANISPSKGSMVQGRKELFQKQVEITKKYRGFANVRYAWLALSKEALSSVMTYGLGHLGLLTLESSYGIGVHLVAANCSDASVKYCKTDENGVKYMILCRVILGNMELVQSGSKQFHPSSESFDSGVDDVQNPKYHVVWTMNMNTHIYPDYVVSFKVSSEQTGCTDRKDELKIAGVNTDKQSPEGEYGSFTSTTKNMGSSHHSHLTSEGSKERVTDLNSTPARTPKSQWMSFPMLFTAIQDKVPSDDMRIIFAHYEQFRTKKITRDELVKQIRRIAGDLVLRTAITTLQYKVNRAGNGELTMSPFPRFLSARWGFDFVDEMVGSKWQLLTLSSIAFKVGTTRIMNSLVERGMMKLKDGSQE